MASKKSTVARGKRAKKTARSSASRATKTAVKKAARKTKVRRAAPAADRALGKKKPAASKKVARPSPAAASSGSARPASKRKPRDAEAAGSTTEGPGVGDRAPSFALLDPSGQRVSSADLAGRAYVLYFYPKDDTPGCTVEACAFRDALPSFEGMGVRVLGVSPDGAASHQRFIDKYGLTFTLLSDEDHEAASAYGVWSLKKNYGREYMGIVRSTFLVDASGVIRGAWRGVRVKGHADEVRAAAAGLS